MNDPNLLDWLVVIFSAVMSGIMAGIAAAFLWFRRSKEQLFADIVDTKEEFEKRHTLLQHDQDRRADKLETNIADLWKLLNQNAVQMGIIATKQAVVIETLEQFKIDGREHNRKLDDLLRSCQFFKREG